MTGLLLDVKPGPVVLLGSGETTPSGRKVFHRLLEQLPPRPKIALLETPAGFELNSPQVIGRVASFLRRSFENYAPQIITIPARQRGTPFSPDEAKIVEVLLEADLIFMGPGSPTYAVRQLRDSLAWYMLMARHRLGATVVLASAACLAISRYVLPVYEIYKVGEELHWKNGLDFFSTYGLPLVFIPHWNNQDGGVELDTSRCFMGKARLARLIDQLPAHLTILGIDEKTALIMDIAQGVCRVVGLGGVTMLHTGHEHLYPAQSDANEDLQQIAERRSAHIHHYQDGESFPMTEWYSGGLEHRLYIPEPGIGLPPEIWQQALEVQQRLDTARQAEVCGSSTPPPEVSLLVDERNQARLRKDWAEADQIRMQIMQLGWLIEDTPEGPRLMRAI